MEDEYYNEYEYDEFETLLIKIWEMLDHERDELRNVTLNSFMDSYRFQMMNRLISIINNEHDSYSDILYNSKKIK